MNKVKLHFYITITLNIHKKYDILLEIIGYFVYWCVNLYYLKTGGL